VGKTNYDREIDLSQVVFYMLLEKSEVGFGELRDLKYKIEKETGRFLDFTRGNVICKCCEGNYMKIEDYHVKRIDVPIDIYNLDFFKFRFGFYDKDVQKALKKHYPLSKSVKKKGPENKTYVCVVESPLDAKALESLNISMGEWQVGKIKSAKKQTRKASKYKYEENI